MPWIQQAIGEDDFGARFADIDPSVPDRGAEADGPIRAYPGVAAGSLQAVQNRIWLHAIVLHAVRVQLFHGPIPAAGSIATVVGIRKPYDGSTAL